jgi:hypothetical protein
MRKEKAGATALKCFALLAMLGTAFPATAQDATTTYQKTAPIDQYLMTDQGAEIALARSAAPESITRDAEILVFRRHGFETAVKGKNGFVCIVARSWTSAVDADFWNPNVRVPMCLNAAAARSYLPRITQITGLILAGGTQAQTTETIAAAVDKKELPAMEPGEMYYIYMRLRQGYAGDSTERWPHQLMFFHSQTAPAIWGASLPDSPVFGSWF